MSLLANTISSRWESGLAACSQQVYDTLRKFCPTTKVQINTLRHHNNLGQNSRNLWDDWLGALHLVPDSHSAYQNIQSIKTNLFLEAQPLYDFWKLVLLCQHLEILHITIGHTRRSGQISIGNRSDQLSRRLPPLVELRIESPKQRAAEGGLILSYCTWDFSTLRHLE